MVQLSSWAWQWAVVDVSLSRSLVQFPSPSTVRRAPLASCGPCRVHRVVLGAATGAKLLELTAGLAGILNPPRTRPEKGLSTAHAHAPKAPSWQA
jgi:hypothetical protein